MSKRDMRNWAYKQIREEHTPLPLWARLLWWIVIVAICGLMAYNYLHAAPVS